MFSLVRPGYLEFLLCIFCRHSFVWYGIMMLGGFLERCCMLTLTMNDVCCMHLTSRNVCYCHVDNTLLYTWIVARYCGILPLHVAACLSVPCGLLIQEWTVISLSSQLVDILLKTWCIVLFWIQKVKGWCYWATQTSDTVWLCDPWDWKLMIRLGQNVKSWKSRGWYSSHANDSTQDRQLVEIANLLYVTLLVVRVIYVVIFMAKGERPR